MSTELKAKIYDLQEEVTTLKNYLSEQTAVLVEVAQLLGVEPVENNYSLEDIVAAAREQLNEVV